MRFALDTFRSIACGTPARRVHALFTFVLWFIVGAYLVSTIMFYLAPAESVWASVIGGVVISVIVSAVKPA